MGKRKYSSESKGKEKRRKRGSNSEHSQSHEAATIQPQNDVVTEIQETNAAEPKLFDIKYFRKELEGKQGQTMALTQFLQLCLNPDSGVDYILEYLKVGGNSHEILRQISQDNKKNLTLATPAFHIFHLIILKVQSSLPHMIIVTEEACRYFLNTFVPTVEIMISENAGPRHRKIILNLLTSMVMLNSDLGVEVLNQVPLTPKSLHHIVEKPNYKEKDNVRTAFVRFMTSFFVDGHLPLIKALLETQGLLSLVIPGLNHDEADVVLMFLNTLKKNIIDNTLISKTMKLKTFSHQVLHNMFKLFTWKGPMGLSNEDKSEARDEIVTLLSEIMLTLFTSHKLGLYFLDHLLGVSDANKNQNLYKALLTLKRPWENKYQCETVLEIVYKCPDLHRAIITVIEQSFQPQHSASWERAVEFLMMLLDKFKPESVVTKLSSLNPLQTANFIRFVTIPVPLLKLIRPCIGSDHTISLYCAKVLVKMLKSLKRYMELIELEDSPAKVLELRSKLDDFFPKHMPALHEIVSLIDNVIDRTDETLLDQDYRLPIPMKADSLLTLLELLLLYNYVYEPSFEILEGTIDMKKILDFSMAQTAGHLSLLKFKAVVLWLLLHNYSISVDNPIFKKLFLMMLEVYTSDEDNTWIEAKDTLQIFLKNTGIYRDDENEVHLMLHALRNTKLDSVIVMGDIIEYVVENGDKLSEYVDNQVEKFENLDESSIENLNKLFNDLMHNRNTDDITFLNTKVPSPFVVGCIQFMQGNKVAKKNLKSFLNLYIANLLHCHYLPDLTEAFIGEVKLQVKSYVADWTTEPACLPEAICNDDTLLNMSRSIIGNEHIPLTNIFPLIESSEESDLTLMNVAYKIDISRTINSSDLFVWAKYLMFCVIRLTDMGKLLIDQQKKIICYFEMIIKLGKKHHMVNVCRDIILDLFGNDHFLRIYHPFVLSKNSSNVLATEFLLQIIEKNQDIMCYLNKKNSILKYYQRKTFKEIEKTLAKINTKKKVKGKLIVEVLNVVGLCEEHNLKALDSILSNSTGIIKYCREDKESSLVFDVLRVLIEKYSKTISLELPNDVVKKLMNLYVSLVTFQELTVHLSNMEESLIQLFENKPHQAVQMAVEDFKQFFYANSARKTTFHLASVLLTHNYKFCNIYKEEISKPEIVSQREITLPLGNAIMNHNQFLIDNKHILEIIYEEYKSNIKKFLEKPHKAGQVYINSTKFIKKLVIECMDVQDCQKILSKSRKFEIVELSHVELLHIVFLKICLAEELHKKEYMINYSLSMLNMTVLAIKENKSGNVLDVLVNNMSSAIQITRAIEAFQIDKTEDFQSITESGVWQNFCKSVLKVSLKVRTLQQENVTEPKLLFLLSTLVKLFYPPDHVDVVNLFDMVTSHSEFLNVMLSHHSADVKLRLLEFLFVLICKNKSVMKTEQIPVYLSAYGATRNACDRLLLSILQFYEANDVPVNEYKPYIWGDSAANHYAVRKSRTSTLWGHPTPNQVMSLFDKDLIENTIKYFPVNQKLNYNYEAPDACSPDNDIRQYMGRVMRDRNRKNCKNTEEMVNNLILKEESNQILAIIEEKDIVLQSRMEDEGNVYDPAFLFPLLSHLLAPGSVASSFKLLRSGLLSVPVMGLSSQCSFMRAAAYHVLHRFYVLLETETRHKNDKLLLTDFITTLRRSLSTATNAPSTEGELKSINNPKLPAIGALYLARALTVCTSPSEPLYKPVNNFLIARNFVDLTVVPDFLSLFHDSEVEAADRRHWVLDLIRDGTKTMTDMNVVFKTMCLKMLMAFYGSVIADGKTRVKILGALESMVAMPRAFQILVEGYGLVSWLHIVVRKTCKTDTAVVIKMFGFIESMIYSLGLNLFATHCAKMNKYKNVGNLIDFKVKSDVEFKILSLICDLLPKTELLDVEDVVTYVRLYNLISKRSIKFLSKKHMLNVFTKCSVNFNKSESVKLIHQALLFNNCIMLSSKKLDNEIVSAEDSLVRELKNLAHTYVG